MKSLLSSAGSALLALALSCVLMPDQGFAQVYKWTDAQGHVHFGDVAPAGQKADTLNLPEPSPEALAPDLSEQERFERQKRLTRALEEDRVEKEQAKAEAKVAEEKKAAYCERFKNRMARLEQSSLVYSENKDGTVTYWKDAEADRYKANQRARYQTECGQV